MSAKMDITEADNVKNLHVQHCYFLLEFLKCFIWIHCIILFITFLKLTALSFGEMFVC